MESMTPADMRAVLDGGNDGFGMGGNWISILLLFALFNGGFGYGGNRGNVATTEDLASGFNFSALQGKTNDILAAVNNNNQVLGNAICQLGYKSLEQTAAISNQMASCCCDLKTAIHAEGEATRNMIQQDKIEALQQQISALQLNQALCGVVRYPTATTYGAGFNPFFGGYACGCQNSI